MINFCATAKGAVSYMVEDPRRVVDVLPIANPEVFVAVPRFCEKLYVGMMQRIAQRPFLANLVERSMSLGAALRMDSSRDSHISPVTRVLARLADRRALP